MSNERWAATRVGPGFATKVRREHRHMIFAKPHIPDRRSASVNGAGTMALRDDFADTFRFIRDCPGLRTRVATGALAVSDLLPPCRADVHRLRDRSRSRHDPRSFPGIPTAAVLATINAIQARRQ
jgi:hypothetical protein